MVLEDGNLRQIMAQLKRILREQVRYALTYQERQAGIFVQVTVSDGHPVEVPPAWDGPPPVA